MIRLRCSYGCVRAQFTPVRRSHDINGLNAISNAAWMNNEYAQKGHELERVLINVDLDIHITSHHGLIVWLPSMWPFHQKSKRYKIELYVQFRILMWFFSSSQCHAVMACHYRRATEIPSNDGNMNLIARMLYVVQTQKWNFNNEILSTVSTLPARRSGFRPILRIQWRNKERLNAVGRHKVLMNFFVFIKKCALITQKIACCSCNAVDAIQRNSLKLRNVTKWRNEAFL